MFAIIEDAMRRATAAPRFGTCRFGACLASAEGVLGMFLGFEGDFVGLESCVLGWKSHTF